MHGRDEEVAVSEGERQVRCVVADDQPFVRDAVSRLLARRGVDVVGLAADGTEAIRLIRALRPDVGVIDLDMPGATGIEVAAALRDLPSTGLVLHSGLNERSQLEAALAAGVRGIVSKEGAFDVLLGAVQAVAAGGTYVDPAAACELVLAGAADGAPGIEGPARAALRLAAEGLGPDAVAARLGMAAGQAGEALDAALATLEREPGTAALGAALRRQLGR